MLKILPILLVIVISFLIYDYYSIETDDNCLWDLESSKKQVNEYHIKNNLSVKYLSISKYNHNLCAIEFSYIDESENFDFLVNQKTLIGGGLSVMRNEKNK